MAIEFVKRVWCDPCQAQDLQTEGKEFRPITVGNQKARVPMLCETHEKEIYQPFMEMLQNCVTEESITNSPKGGKPIGGGVPTSGVKQNPITPEARERGIKCLIEGCTSISKSRSTLGGHFRTFHELSLSEYCAENGIEVLTTVDGREVPAPGPGQYMEPAEDAKVAKCLITGCTRKFEWPEDKRPRHALAVHYTMVHGITAEERKKIGDNNKAGLNKAVKK